MSTLPRVAIVGAGLGGCASAALLQQQGLSPVVYEQASAVARLGAGIHLSPNVTRVLERIGVCQTLSVQGMHPRAWVSRDWDTGDITLDFKLRDIALARYGSPYLTVHRGDLHKCLVATIAPGALRLGHQLVDLRPMGDTIELIFANGTRAEADIVIGADGVHSRVREILQGQQSPIYTGYVAHRSIVPMSRLPGAEFEDSTKWWHPDRHIVVYYIDSDRSHIYFVTGVPQAQWEHDDWVREGAPKELQAAFEGFHPQVQQLLGATTDVANWAILERKPMSRWSEERVVLLGDACHPMKPHMGQGAAMAIEDAAMLVRCMSEHATDVEQAFQVYAANRQPRAAKVQHFSHHNDWLQYESEANPDWVFGYNVFEDPLI
ncbi:MAG: NAD(P)-binding protein [Chromatiales bacterium]|jgi:6-hydroxynicotinate 3-monooxygenase|nr:NAD(P)-binding protein [Chromatiales bacterium]